MNTYAIITDTTSDLPKDYQKENDIDIIPLYYSMDNVIYGDEKDMEPSKFYSLMRSGKMPTTMASNPERIQKCFSKHLDAGKDILYIAFSSGLSSSYNSAAMVSQNLSEDYPNQKIIVIDSKSASMGEGLLVYYAIENQKAGLNIEENAEWIENNKLHLCHQFTVNDLNHLHRGGRVSKATAIIGTMINVKPVLHVDNKGHLIPLCNVRGRKKALTTLVDNMEVSSKNYKNDIVFISHGDCLEDAKYVQTLIQERLGINDFMINYICPTVGTHSGYGTLALFYMGDKR